MKISKIQTTNFYRKIVIAFAAITALIIILIAYFAFSKTVAYVSLNPQEKSTSFNIDVKKELTDEDKNYGNVLAGYLLKTTVNDQKTFENPNKGEEVPAQATGKVTIYNNFAKVQPLAATTRLLTTDNILFRIKNRVDVPAHGKLENVEIYADQMGASGNIGPTKFTIPGLSKELQEKIYAESVEPTTGGLKSAKVVTAENISQAREELINDLLADAKVELEKNPDLKTGDQVLEQTMARVISSEKSSIKAGEEAAAFDMTMKINAFAVVFDEDELLAIALDKLKDELSADQQLKSYDKKDLTYTVENFNFDKQQATLKVKFSAFSTPKLSSPIFDRNNVIGKDTQEIKAYFSNFEEIKSVEIKFSPFWVRRAPNLKDHIEIRIRE